MEDGKGEIAVRAYTVWVYMDLEKGRPAKVDPEEAARYGCGGTACHGTGLPESTGCTRVRAEAMPDFPVRRYHIDTNEHVNNCQYVQMALECIPHPEEITKMRAEYKKSAVFGDQIYPRYAKRRGTGKWWNLAMRQQNPTPW